ncbi:MAG: thiamine pyrophosphate-binding protein [Treponema sp.]
MKKRVADIVVDTLLELGINETFCVVGGGAMHLNNAFEINDNMHITFCHHEQACAFAAESFAKYSGKIACVSVTSGPGGVNALNGVYSAYVDYTPMIVIAGYPRYETATPCTGLNLRCRGVQEFDIVNTVKTMTKYSKLILEPEEIKAEIKKAYDIAMEGRRGPVWLSIPLDIQAIQIEEDELIEYKKQIPVSIVDKDTIAKIVSELKNAKRPCILTGTGIRYGDAVKEFIDFKSRIKIPIVGASLNPDLLPFNAELYYGTSGSSGPRTGNYILQNADLILVLANSLSTKQTGFNVDLFAPNAKFIMVDAEIDETKKPGLHIDIPIQSEIKAFLTQYNNTVNDIIEADSKWIDYCDSLKEFFKNKDMPSTEGSTRVCSKIFGHILMDKLPENCSIALGNSSCGGCILTYGVHYPNQRVIVNYNAGSMGDDLPEAIGMAIASKDPVYCYTGDGSLMMNLQELETIKYNKLSIKVIVFSNNGYGAIRNTCKNFFNGKFTGCDSDSGIDFPDFVKVADAFGYEYFSCKNNDEISSVLDSFIAYDGLALLEVQQEFVDPVIPRVMSKMDANGKFVTPSLLDMYPYLSAEEGCYLKKLEELLYEL